MHLPASGIAPDAVRHLLREASERDVAWREGRSFSLVYDSPDWHAELVAEALAMYAAENALSHAAFPSVAFFESETIAMVSSVVAPGADAFGTFTSGGTESALLAMKAYRDHAPAEGRVRDEILLPVTAHPSFWKAADYLRMRLRTVPVGASGEVDPADIAAAISDRTAVVVVSAPNFPFGTVDPIGEVAAVAARHGAGVHVDAALGGLFLPFLRAAGVPAPAFGLDVPGVTSVSVDLHKYGYGPKGGSVLLFASRELRRASYYVATGWPGGAYAASGALGTRPVGPAAGAYAAMASLGHSGYSGLVAGVMASARRLRSGLAQEGFEVIGAPPMSVFAVTAESGPSVPSVARRLEARGWRIDAQQEPDSMHFIVFPRHERVLGTFLADVRASVVEAGSAEGAGAGSEGLSSYGVMVRGGTGVEGLLEHLDERFDGQATGTRDVLAGAGTTGSSTTGSSTTGSSTTGEQA